MGEIEMGVIVPGELRPPGRWGHRGTVALRKARPGWTPFKWERVGDDSLFTGGVESAYKNGRPKWAKPHSQIVVTLAEVEAAEEEYEREHERCRQCFGSGQDWIGWSAREGNRYAPCRRCCATGRPSLSALSEKKEERP